MTIWSATCRRGFLGALSSGSKRETSPSWASRAVWIADQVVLRASSSAAPRRLLSPWDAGSVAPSDAVARLRAREAGLARALACDPSASWADRSAAPRALQASTAASGSGASARGTSVRVCSLDSTVPPISCFSQSWPQPERAPAATADSSSMARRLGAVPTRAVHVDRRRSAGAGRRRRSAVLMGETCACRTARARGGVPGENGTHERPGSPSPVVPTCRIGGGGGGAVGPISSRN